MNFIDYFKNNKVFVIITGIVWASFFFLAVGASISVKSAFKSEKDADAIESIKIPSIQKREASLDPSVYSKISAAHASGKIAVENAPNGIVVSSKNLSDYEEWKSQLVEIMTSSEADSWRIDSMCLGTCPSGNAYQALVSGSRTEVIQVK